MAARARLEDGRGAAPDGPEANARALRWGAPPAVLLGAIYYIHPPPAVLPLLPLAALPFPAAALVWLALSGLALGWLSLSLLRLAAPEGRVNGVALAGTIAALALWPPVLHNFEKGQWSIVLAALLAGGLRALDARPRRAGVLFGVAAALKVTPIVLLGLLVVRHRRAAAAMAATFGAIVLASLATVGVAPWRAFLGGAAHNAAVWAPWIANTASPAGVYARLFDGGTFARPLVAAPALASAAFDATAVALLAVALLALRRPSAPTVAPASQPAALAAAWLTLPVLLNPLGWSHVLALLLAPAVVAARDGGRASQVLAVSALAAFSIPRQALAALAGPIPCSPGRGLALGLHAAFAVVLFATLVKLGRRAGGRPAA